MRIVASVDEFTQRLGVLAIAMKKTIELAPTDGGLGVDKAVELFANVEEVRTLLDFSFVLRIF